MSEKLILISTCIERAPQKTRELLANGSKRGEQFGLGFHPFLVVNKKGDFFLLEEEEEMPPLVQLIVFIHNHELEFSFIEWFQLIIPKHEIYCLFHKGDESIYQIHRTQLTRAANPYQEKLFFHLDHHTTGSYLGDGLEKIAKAVSANPVDQASLEAALYDLVNRPNYLNMFSEAKLLLWKSLQLLKIKIDRLIIESDEALFDEINKIRSSPLIKHIPSLINLINSFDSLSNFPRAFEQTNIFLTKE